MRRRSVLVLAAVASAVAGCGDDPEPSVADQRAAEVERAAQEAGLDDEVAAFLVLASRGLDATYTAEVPGDDGTVLRVTSRPPDRRVDVLAGDEIVEWRIVTGGVAYRCTSADGCVRTDSFVEPPGLFAPSALDATVDTLAEQVDTHSIDVVRRPMLGVEATCLVTAPLDDPDAVDEICLSPDGVLLRVAVGDQVVDTLSYTEGVQDESFDLGA